MIYLSVCVNSISPEPFERFFIKLHPNVPLSEVVCIANDSAMQTQGQGHTSRSWDLPLNFVSFELTICQIFIELHSNVPLSELVCRTHDSAMQTQSRSHFKVMGFCGGGYGCHSDCCLV